MRQARPVLREVDVDGHHIPAWRGIPILPRNKIPITEENTSSIFAMRVGEDKEGVIDLTPRTIPYRELRTHSSLATGIEESFLTAYKEGSFHYLMIVADRV